MSIHTAEIGQEYIVKGIDTGDDEMKNFLFTLGCYSGEKIKLISTLNKSYVILIKNTRYGIDADLAKAILI